MNRRQKERYAKIDSFLFCPVIAETFFSRADIVIICSYEIPETGDIFVVFFDLDSGPLPPWLKSNFGQEFLPSVIEANSQNITEVRIAADSGELTYYREGAGHE